MARLLDDLLEASRGTQNKIDLRKEFVDLAAITRDALEVAKEAMQARRLEINAEIPSNPVYVERDPARLQQVEANLLGNAAKYTPPGGRGSFELRREGDLAILVVEDSEDSRDMLCAFLEHAGFECKTAADGQEALEVLANYTPDVAILDLGLPGIDGFELARRIRSDPKNELVTLIALSGYGQPDDRASARAAGFDQHLVKPVAPSELLRVLTHSEAAEFDGPVRPPGQ